MTLATIIDVTVLEDISGRIKSGDFPLFMAK